MPLFPQCLPPRTRHISTWRDQPAKRALLPETYYREPTDKKLKLLVLGAPTKLIAVTNFTIFIKESFLHYPTTSSYPPKSKNLQVFRKFPREGRKIFESLPMNFKCVDNHLLILSGKMKLISLNIT